MGLSPIHLTASVALFSLYLRAMLAEFHLPVHKEVSVLTMGLYTVVVVVCLLTVFNYRVNANPTLKPHPLKIPNTAKQLLTIFSNCQFVTVKNNEPSSKLVPLHQEIIEQSQIQGKSVTVIDVMDFHNKTVTRHSDNRVVYFGTATMFFKRGAIDLVAIRFSQFQHARHIFNDKKDLMVQLVDNSWPWRDQYSLVPYRSRLCGIIEKMVFVQYNFRTDATGRIEMFRFQMHCADSRPCVKALHENGLEGLKFDKIHAEIQGAKVNFHRAMVFLETESIRKRAPSTLVTYYANQQLRYMKRGHAHLRATKMELMPYVHLADMFNFTIIPEGWHDDPYEMCALHVQVAHERGTTNGRIVSEFSFLQIDEALLKYAVLINSQSKYKILHGGSIQQISPLWLQSVLNPLPWEAWTALLVAIALIAMVSKAKIKKIDLKLSITSVIGPLLSQASGMETKWYGSWVFVVVFISNWYLAFLSSIQIVPRVERSTDQFRDILAKNYSFYSKPDLAKLFKAYASDVAVVLNLQGTALEDQVTLRNKLRPVPDSNITAEFLKFESSAYLSTTEDLEVLLEVLPRLLKRSYSVLRENFWALPAGTYFQMAGADVVAHRFAHISASGIESYWKMARRAQAKEYGRSLYRGILSAYKKDPGEVAGLPLSDSLLKESFFLWGLGLACALMLAAVEVLNGLMSIIFD